MDTEQFFFKKRIYLLDTNAEGNVYFARFFELQGMAREEFFRQNVSDSLAIMQSGAKIITKNAWMVYEHEGHLFDEIGVQVQTASLKAMSLELIFTFTNEATKEIVGRGGEKLAFADPSGQLVPIPLSIRESAKRFLAERAPELEEIRLRK